MKSMQVASSEYQLIKLILFKVKTDYFDLICRKLKPYYSYWHYLSVELIWLLVSFLIYKKNLKKTLYV